MSERDPNDDSLLISYMKLRRAVGLVGVALPFLLAFGGMLLEAPGIRDSISSYYWTLMRDVFVGALCVIGTFLLTYRGYERIDNLAGHLACVFAVGVALFPTAPEKPTDLQSVIGVVHYGFAAALFSTLAFFCLFLFTKTHPSRPRSPRKIQRDRVYRICGWVIIACILLLAAVGAFLPRDAPLRAFSPVFWLEAIAVVAFGVSWLTKGEAILADR